MRRALAQLTAEAQYADYLRRLNARAVLEHYGVENDRDEVTSIGETEVIHSCLLDRVDRHHNNGDSNPSAACNLDRRLYVCYSFWGGDLFHLIQKLEGKESFDQILPIISPFLDGATLEADEWQAEFEKLRAMLEAPSAYTISTPAYSDRVLSPWAFIHPYLHERGIDSETASRLRIGWREDENRITIPHFWDGKLVGWQARAVPERPGEWPGTARPQPKYRSTPGFPKSDTLYYDHSRPFPTLGRVILVESPFSVVKALALGLDSPVLATFGAKVSANQAALLRDFSEVIVWADPDPAGQVMERRLSRLLCHHPGLKIVTPDPGMDLADYDTVEAVTAKIDQAEYAVLKMK